MRAFIAIELPEYIKKEVDRLIKQEQKKELPIKWIGFENLHITLKFLGEIDESMKEKITPILKKISGEFSSSDISLSGIGCFPHPGRPRVLWIGVKQGARMLADIACEIDKSLYPLGFKEEKRFHSHLTIGRIKKHCRVDDILTREIETEAFSVDSVTLFSSVLKPTGPTYQVVDKFSLG